MRPEGTVMRPEGTEMRLAILGATGRIGGHLMNWALFDGPLTGQYRIALDYPARAELVGVGCAVRRQVRCAAMRSRYQPNEAFGVRCWVAKSMCTRPNRWL
jgi:hypothetical protein